MPFQRPTLTELEQQVQQDISSSAPGLNALLRFSNEYVIGKSMANLVYLMYGYLDYISLNSVPATAVDENLEMWAALKNVFRNPATQASGVVQFVATSGTVPAGTPLARGDGVQATSTADATASGGVVNVPAKIVQDPTGLTGAFGNTPIGTSMTLGVGISGVVSSGVVSTAFTGGADLETDDNLRSRMLAAYQTVPGAANAAAYITWAESVSGVTRAWVVPYGMGPGTVVVYTMFDQAESGTGGFPVGTNGTATGETRDANATGDQLTVANAIYTLQPVGPLVYSAAPTANPIAFTIAGIPGASTATKAAILAAVQDVFLRDARADGVGQIPLSDVEAAIGSVAGTTGFVLTAPVANIPNTTGLLATISGITYT